MREQFPGYGAPRRRSSREVDNGSSPGDIWALEDDAADRVAQLISRGIASASVRLVFNETVELLGKDLATVAPAEWLNDEIINYYGLLVMARAKTALAAATTAAAAGAAPGGGAALRVHYFNSFFFSKLRDIGYSSVRRWSKKFDVFDDLDMLVFPVHWGAHWTLGCVNVAARRIEYYDSLLGNEDKEFFRLVRGYVENEWIKKDRGPMCWDGWTEHYPRDAIPRQLNYYDCGVFTLAMLESITRSARRFAFDQSHMDAWRHRIVHELSEGRLIT
ncbi:hypothetical protein BC828DRAFT_348397 [Blastocladiella britannica]|nr:hypothetical protein BC828DRAFT_348397 [Blastocladiella britannica]